MINFTEQRKVNKSMISNSNLSIDRFLDSIWTERGLSTNTLGAYKTDLRLLAKDLAYYGIEINLARKADILSYISKRVASGIKSRTTARQISSYRAYFQFLLRTNQIKIDPTLDIEMPRIGRILPKTLTEQK